MPLDVSCVQLENYQVLARSGHHAWIADEPPRLGGDDLGPNPFALLLGALGSCTVITMAAYAAKARIPLEKTWVDLTGHWEKQDDKETYHVELAIRVRGELGEKDLTRLERGAKKCPVHKVLAPGMTITHRLEVADA